jgi:hypothetical protein
MTSEVKSILFLVPPSQKKYFSCSRKINIFSLEKINSSKGTGSVVITNIKCAAAATNSHRDPPIE